MRITMKDIAVQANVSLQVVSRALSDSTACRISAGKREEIKRIARELGFKPNYAALQLRGKKTKTVAIMNSMPKMNYDENILKLIMLLISGFNEVGYSAYCDTFTDDPARNLENVRTLIQRGVEHFVFLGCPFGHTEIAAELESYKISFISTSRGFKRWAARDVIRGAEAIFRHRISVVGENFRLICHRSEANEANERIHALRNIFPELSSEQIIDRFVFCAEDIVFAESDYEHAAYAIGSEATRQLLEREPNIGALCYMTDIMAVSGGRYLLKQGNEKWRHIMLSGFDNNKACVLNFPLPVTSVSYDQKEMSDLLIRHALTDEPCEIFQNPILHLRTQAENRDDYPQWTETIIEI